MRVAFRADASVLIGTGHVMRCLTLATQLRREGALVEFTSRSLPGDLCDLIEEKGFHVHRLSPQMPGIVFDNQPSVFSVDARVDCALTAETLRLDSRSVDWLIVDHYGLDATWERCMRPFVRKIFVIDDLADRQHDCDALLDQNLYEETTRRYDGLVPAHCAVFLGPAHALLREEFHAVRPQTRVRDGRVRRIMVFFGGGDPTNETTKMLEALRLLEQTDIAVDVVVGKANTHREAVRTLCEQMPNTAYHCQVDNMAELMVAADLAVGAGGSATWERCYLGLPTLTVVTAENQLATTRALAQVGGAQYLGWFHEVDIRRLAQAIADACTHPEMLQEMSGRAVRLMGTEVDHFRPLQFILDIDQAVHNIHGRAERRQP